MRRANYLFGIEDSEFVVGDIKVSQSVGNTAKAVLGHLADEIVGNVEDLQLGIMEESVWQEAQLVVC